MKKTSSWLFSLFEWVMCTAALNLLFLLFCLPVVTAGAAFTALCSGHRALAKKEPCFRAFFHSFRAGFWRATVAWLITLPIDGFLFWHCLRIAGTPGENVLPFLLFSLFCTLLVTAITVTIFIFYSRFEGTLPQILLFGAEIAMANPLRSGLIAFLMLFPLALLSFDWPFFLLFSILWVFFYFSVAAWAAIWIMNKPFIRFAQQTLGMDTTIKTNKEDADNDY